PIDLQDVIVEILDPQAQPRHPQTANRLELMIGQRAWLALKCDLLCLVPRQQLLHAVGQVPELVHRKVRRCAAAEVNEARRAAAYKRFARIQLELLQHRVNVVPNRRRIFVRIDLEIAKVAALAAKRDVNVHSEWRAALWRAFQSSKNLAVKLGLPK